MPLPKAKDGNFSESTSNHIEAFLRDLGFPYEENTIHVVSDRCLLLNRLSEKSNR